MGPICGAAARPSSAKLPQCCAGCWFLAVEIGSFAVEIAMIIPLDGVGKKIALQQLQILGKQRQLYMTILIFHNVNATFWEPINPVPASALIVH